MSTLVTVEDVDTVIKSVQQADGSLRYVARFVSPEYVAMQDLTEADAWEGAQKWLAVAKSALEDALREVEAMEKVL